MEDICNLDLSPLVGIAFFVSVAWVCVSIIKS